MEFEVPYCRTTHCTVFAHEMQDLLGLGRTNCLIIIFFKANTLQFIF